MTGRARREGGFALVEALASLVVVGMITLMLVSGVATGRRVWERIDGREAAGETLDAAQTTLRARIEQVYPATLYNESPPSIDFRGAPETLAFLSNPPQSARPAPLRRYGLGVDNAGQLVLSSISDAAGPKTTDPDTAPAAREVLLSGVQRIDIAYFGARAPDFQRRWRPAWADDPALPELVRVRVEFRPGDPRRWPDLIARPAATIDASCLLSPITHRCKGRA